MRRLKNSGITVMVVVSLLAGAGVAWADTDEDVLEVEIEDTTGTEQTEDTDTLFNFGYDFFNRIFVWGLSSLDAVYDCTLENGPLTATYGETDDEGVVPVDDLEDEAGVVSFPNRPPGEVAEDLEPADAPVEYSGADGDCGVSGGDVTGPNGQVNHGMFMRLFNSLYDGPGRGCVVRHLAQSDLGKEDQKVEAGDETVVDPVEAGDTGTIDFTSVESDCQRGKKADDEGGDDLDAQVGNSNGRPDHAGRPDHPGNPDHAGKPDRAGKPDNAGRSNSPGNSGSAPGHNK